MSPRPPQQTVSLADARAFAELPAEVLALVGRMYGGPPHPALRACGGVAGLVAAVHCRIEVGETPLDITPDEGNLAFAARFLRQYADRYWVEHELVPLPLR